MKKILLFLAILASLVWLAVFSFPKENLHLVFCNVGQGDAILVTQGLNQVLIDGGPDERVLQCLSDHLPFWDRTIELIVLTHPQADHITGLISVLERYQVQNFLVNNLVNDTERFWKFREALLEEGAKIYNPMAGDEIKVGGMDLAVLWPEEKLGTSLAWQKEESREKILGAASYLGNLNETSIVLEVSFGNFCALLTGDISQNTESQLDRVLDKVAPCQVLKVGHHGSKHSTAKDFLEKLKPKLAIISVGKNSFGHPSEEVIKRLRDNNIKIFRTDQDGEIEIVSDGKSMGLLGYNKDVF